MWLCVARCVVGCGVCCVYDHHCTVDTQNECVCFVAVDRDCGPVPNTEVKASKGYREVIQEDEKMVSTQLRKYAVYTNSICVVLLKARSPKQNAKKKKKKIEENINTEM